MSKKKEPRGFISHPFPYHEKLILQVDTLTNTGLGLGRINGWVIMVPFCLPGEKVQIRIFRNEKNYSMADLVAILEPSPRRIEARCELFGVCGGCQYQHMDYAAQLEWKRRQVEELLERFLGLTVSVAPTRPSPLLYGYRSKITPHFNGAKGPVGFLKQGQRTAIVDVPECSLATEAINRALPSEREKRDFKKRRRGGTLLLRETREGVLTDPRERGSVQVGKYVYQFCVGEFFQNNLFILPDLIDYVVREASVGGLRYLMDIYCGVGVFAIAGRSYFEKSLGIEVSAEAIRFARVNAQINGVESCDFQVGSAEKIFATASFPPEETAVIIDPPRRGCDRDFIVQLLNFSPRRIVYVSCSPDTQMRDMAYFLEGGYSIENIQPFDLFPQTRHVENVIGLYRSAVNSN